LWDKLNFKGSVGKQEYYYKYIFMGGEH